MCCGSRVPASAVLPASLAFRSELVSLYPTHRGRRLGIHSNLKSIKSMKPFCEIVKYKNEWYDKTFFDQEQGLDWFGLMYLSFWNSSCQVFSSSHVLRSWVLQLGTSRHQELSFRTFWRAKGFESHSSLTADSWAHEIRFPRYTHYSYSGLSDKSAWKVI